MNRCEGFIRDRLAEGPVPLQQLIAEARELEIGESTLYRWGKRLGIISAESPDGIGSVWSLPPREVAVPYETVPETPARFEFPAPPAPEVEPVAPEMAEPVPPYPDFIPPELITLDRIGELEESLVFTQQRVSTLEETVAALPRQDSTAAVIQAVRGYIEPLLRKIRAVEKEVATLKSRPITSQPMALPVPEAEEHGDEPVAMIEKHAVPDEEVLVSASAAARVAPVVPVSVSPGAAAIAKSFSLPAFIAGRGEVRKAGEVRACSCGRTTPFRYGPATVCPICARAEVAA